MSDAMRTGAPPEPAVLADIDSDGVAVVTLNRPAKLNAWTAAMGELYHDTLEDLERDPAVRVIMVTGAGRAFCAGADMSLLDDLSSSGGSKLRLTERPYWNAIRIGKPVVAAVRGAAVGVGFHQALCCDLRFCADDAKFVTAYAKRGLIGELGFPWHLTRLVGLGNAMDMMLSGRAVGAEEALRIGLVNRIFPADQLHAEALAYCRMLATECSPSSMRAMKRQVYEDMLSSLPDAQARAAIMLEEAMASPDFKEGISAFMEKRPAAFNGLGGDGVRLDIYRS